MTSNVVHRLVGYDRTTEHVAVEYDIPPAAVQQVIRMIELAPDDPDAIYCYPLSPLTARTIGQIIGRDVETEGMDFFLEAFAEPTRATG